MQMFFYYVGNIACDISYITRKSTAENQTNAADFGICAEHCGQLVEIGVIDSAISTFYISAW